MEEKQSERQREDLYVPGFVLGILSIIFVTLYFDFMYAGFILGVVGLVLSIINKYKTGIVLNVISVSLAVLLFLGTFFSTVFSYYGHQFNKDSKPFEPDVYVEPAYEEPVVCHYNEYYENYSGEGVIYDYSFVDYEGECYYILELAHDPMYKNSDLFLILTRPGINLNMDEEYLTEGDIAEVYNMDEFPIEVIENSKHKNSDYVYVFNISEYDYLHFDLHSIYEDIGDGSSNLLVLFQPILVID